MLKRLLILLTATVMITAPAQALRDGDTVRIVVPYRPGGGYDTQARLAAPYVEAALRADGLTRVNVIVENVTGGAGAIATTQVYSARPTGTTLLFLDPESSIWQSVVQNAPFDVSRFSFIAQMSIDPMVFMVRADLGLLDFAETVVRSQRTPLLMGTAGKGGHDHLMPVILQKMLNDAGVQIRFSYVHFDGTAPLLASFRRREAEAALEVSSIFGPAAEAGELRFLFDFSPDLPWPDAWDVLPLRRDELEVFGVAANYRRVFVGPPGLPRDILERLRRAFARALANSDLQAKAREARLPITFLDGETTAQLIATQVAFARRFAPDVARALD